PQRTQPEAHHKVAKGAECREVSRHGVIGEVAPYDLRQPAPLFRDQLVHSPSQFLLDCTELYPHAIAPGFPLKPELTLARPPADENEAQELEGFRFSEPALRSSGHRMAAKLDQAGLVRVQRQRELLQPFAHRFPEAPGVRLVLETDDDVVSIPHDDHVTRGLVPSPALGPEIEHVVKVDVREQRRDHRALPRPLVTDRNDSVFQYSRLQPFLDQADDARVADPMLDEADCPLLTNFIERSIHRLPITTISRITRRLSVDVMHLKARHCRFFEAIGATASYSC